MGKQPPLKLKSAWRYHVHSLWPKTASLKLSVQGGVCWIIITRQSNQTGDCVDLQSNGKLTHICANGLLGLSRLNIHNLFVKNSNVSLSLYIYIYFHAYIYIYIYMYICMYMYVEREGNHKSTVCTQLHT